MKRLYCVFSLRHLRRRTFIHNTLTVCLSWFLVCVFFFNEWCCFFFWWHTFFLHFTEAETEMFRDKKSWCKVRMGLCKMVNLLVAQVYYDKNKTETCVFVTYFNVLISQFRSRRSNVLNDLFVIKAWKSKSNKVS